MERIWNALRYGDNKTRICIGSIIGFSVLAIVFIVTSCLVGKFYLFIIGMLAGVVAIIISQTFTLVDQNFVAEINVQGEKNRVKALKAQKGEKIGIDVTEIDKINEDEKELEAKEKSRFDQYNTQVLKKIKKKYHVKKDHRPIIIDSSKNYRIKECPAFIWRVHNKVFLLLLEKEPRKICISRELIKSLEYVPHIFADRGEEYKAFQKDNLITRVFEGYIPDYFNSKDGSSKLKYKNLYMIYPDIRISNRSASKVLDLLSLSFMPKDKITESKKLNIYFKRVYAANILYKDRVYSITEYKDSVENILGEMCHADLLKSDFDLTIENLVRGKMISQQYADYYINLKNKEN